jgi:hypothetical protein
VALAEQKNHFFVLRDSLFDEGDSSGADPGRGSFELDALNKYGQGYFPFWAARAISATSHQ